MKGHSAIGESVGYAHQQTDEPHAETQDTTGGKAQVSGTTTGMYGFKGRTERSVTPLVGQALGELLLEHVVISKQETIYL